MVDSLPISEPTWRRLVEANQVAIRGGRGAPGVFGTGVGPEYRRGGLLYVGKSPGPQGHAVGSGHDQAVSVNASTQWMIERRNPSPFWQFVDKIDRTRRSIAWTNVCKMDRKGREAPPTGTAWSQISASCMAALSEEIVTLAPKVVVFAISDTYRADVWTMLTGLGYRKISSACEGDGWTSAFATPDGMHAITTRHPQGWENSARDPVVDMVKGLLAAPST